MKTKRDKQPSLLLITFAIAFAYFALGITGIKIISTLPGYATPIWIPSGIALGAALIWGLRVLPGVFFGSLLVNFFISNNVVQHYSLLIGLIVATGAALQTLVGWLLIKEWIGLKNPLNHPNDILLFAFLSGPISSLVNATWSNSILFLLKIIPRQHFFFNWGTWWIGDSVGILIFTPIFLIIFSHFKIWHRRTLPILIPLLLSFLGVIAIYFFANNTMSVLQTWSVLTSGLLFCVLINIILFIVDGQKNVLQQKMARKTNALKLEEKKNLLFLQSAGEGIFGLDKDYKITFINPAAEKMLGFNENELTGKDFLQSVQHHYPNGEPYDRNKSAYHRAMFQNKVSHVRNEIFWKKNGEYLYVEYTCSPISDGKKTSGIVVVFKDITLELELEKKLHEMAHLDTLTKLPNRAGFFEKLELAIENARINNYPIAICFIDLDNFKQVNDELGHNIGDEFLIAVSKILQSEFGDNNFIARLGGDEFAIIIEDIPNLDKLKLTLDQALKSFKKPVIIRSYDIVTSVSIGVALYPSAGETVEELIKHSDIAMYYAKEHGKNSYAFFDKNMSNHVLRQHKINLVMHSAFDNKEFFLTYQPIIDTTTMHTIGVEVFIRWFNDKLGMISPAEFITLAEKNSLIYQIGEWVLQQALEDYNVLSAAFNNPHFLLAINTTPMELKNEKFISKLSSLLNASGIDRSALILEISESGIVRSPQQTISAMNELKNLGIQLALDDFGVNYTSMQYLKDLPVSILKIDSCFMQDIIDNSKVKAIMKAITQLAHGLHLKTVIEGIETLEQFNLVKEIGTECVQGFYFGKPFPLQDLIHYMQKEKERIISL